MRGLMDRLHANKGESRAYPTAREAISTWTRCGERPKPTTGIQVVWLPTPPVPRLAHSGCPQSRITSSSLTGKEVFPKAVWPVRVRKFPSMSMKRRATRLVAVRVFCLLWHL